MKQLINGYDNEEIVSQTNMHNFIMNVNTSDVTEKDLRIAIQSYKLASGIIEGYVSKIRKASRKKKED